MDSEIKSDVRDRYARAATSHDCCTGVSCCDPITSDLYEESQALSVPESAIVASLGCGNPVAMVELHEGQTVLDLGSGGGIDVFLSARRVGPTGKVYGLDMTDEMLELARRNQQEAGIQNVEFLKGEIENVPLPDNSVDVVISNCVINLSVDKVRALREAFRVLRPGGLFAVSDVVLLRALPSAIRENRQLWLGCVAGALGVDEYKQRLSDAGFESPTVEVTRILKGLDAAALLSLVAADVGRSAGELDGAIASGFVRAKKPIGCQ